MLPGRKRPKDLEEPNGSINRATSANADAASTDTVGGDVLIPEDSP